MGNDPDAFTEVIQARCSAKPDGIGRRNNSPARIEPQRGKVSENNVNPPPKEHWAVLHEYEAGLYFANDAGEFGPQS